jgi:hypothetical protein
LLRAQCETRNDVRIDDVPRPAAQQHVGGIAGAAELGVPRRFDGTAGAMRREQHVVESEERMGRGRAGEREDVDPLEHIQRRTADAPDSERLDECGLVDDRAPRSVDQHGGRLHAGQPAGVDQVQRVIDQRQVERNEVGFRQHAVERQLFHSASFRSVGVL